jgi:hypothetical protein
MRYATIRPFNSFDPDERYVTKEPDGGLVSTAPFVAVIVSNDDDEVLEVVGDSGYANLFRELLDDEIEAGTPLMFTSLVTKINDLMNQIQYSEGPPDDMPKGWKPPKDASMAKSRSARRAAAEDGPERA